MKTMYTIWQDLFEAHPFHGKGIAVKPECVIVINLMEYCFYPLVESWNSDMLQIARLIDGIVASDSVVVLIPRSDLLPEPNRPILVILIIPKFSIVGGVARVPIRVLTTW